MLIKTMFVSCLVLAVAAVQAQTIKKCQDADGNWHYGDYAAQECERSRVTEMDDRGLRVREQGPPPTREEVEARQASRLRAEEDKIDQARQRKLDKRLLTTYESEQSIRRTLDERLAAIDRALEADRNVKKQLEEELESLQQRSGRKPSDELAVLLEQISDYDRVIDARMQQRNGVIERYEQDMQRYRDLTQGPSDTPVD